MNEIFGFLNEYSEALTVIFTAVVTLSTVVYAILTWRLVSETRRLREVQTEPKIHITLNSLDFLINITRLKIENIGLGSARNLKIDPLAISGGESAQRLLEDFTKSNFFKTGLRHFGPGQIIYSLYTDMRQDLEGKAASVLSFKLHYENDFGEKYEDEIIIDMSEMKSDYRFKPHLYEIAKSLEAIQKDIHHLSTGFQKLKVNIYTSKDRKEEQEFLERQWDEEEIGSRQ